MKIFFAFLLFIATSLVVNAQKKTDSLAVFFKTNNYSLEGKHKQLIHHHLDSLRKYKWDTLYVKITGFADVSASDKYNLKLSEKRAKSVKTYLKADTLIDTYTLKALGEKGAKISDKAFSRRVEVCFYGKRHSKMIATDSLTTDTIAKTLKPKKKIYKDSIIVDNGVNITIPKELVQKLDEDKKMSITVKNMSIRTDSVNGLLTQDEFGNPLSSGGMFSLDFKSSNPKDTVLSTPVIFRFPIPDGPCMDDTASMSPWTFVPGKGWTESKTPAIKIVTIEGKKYYEVAAIRPGLCNLDKRRIYYKTKFKIKNSKSYAMDSVVVFDDCNTVLLKRVAKNKKKTTVKMRIPIRDEKLKVKYYVTNRETGKSLVSDAIPLVTLKKGGLFSFVWERIRGKKKSKILLYLGLKRSRKYYMH